MWYDVLMLAIVLFTTIRGAAKGVAWQLAAIAALVLCFLFATPLSLVVAPAIGVEPPLNRWLAMLVIYLVFSFGCFAAARMLRGWLESLKFEEYDRHLGAVFGLLKGVAIGLVLTFFVVCLSETGRDYVLATHSGGAARQIMQSLHVVMPAELDRVLEPYVERFGDDGALLAGDQHSPDPADDGGSGSADPVAGRPGTGPVSDLIEGLEERFRDELVEAVRESVPRLAPRPSVTPSPDAGERAPGPESLDGIIEKLALIFSGDPGKREALRAEIEALLNGVPARVGAAALLDWQADLLGRGSDPDPGTDVASSLDDRLRRQVRAAGVSLEALPRPVRERLGAAEQP